MEITKLYTNPRCRACKITKQRLDEAGVLFSVIDIETTDGVADFLRYKEYKQAPVVFSPVGDWSGLNEEMIDKLIEHEQGEAW